jgi:gamma-resorcylate decarboxylase
MQGKVGLEEHFAITQTLADSNVFLPDRCWGALSRRLIDVRRERIAAMDAHGMEMMILSLNAPTVQGIPEPERAETVARAANDALAEEVARRPDRFGAFAALPMQDVEMAARELERCVKELKFCGALVNGFSQVADPDAALYYDTAQYWAVLGDGRAPRRSVLSAPAQSLAGLGADL